MRGGKPRPIEVDPADVPTLQQIARSKTRPWYQVQRARILSELAEGGRTQVVASQNRCDERTVRRICSRYERLGRPGLLAPLQRSG